MSDKRTTRALLSRPDVLTVRWDRIVTRDETGTVWALCVADSGQPVALVLDEEHAEALAGSLLDTEDGEEAEPPATAAAEVLAIVAEWCRESWEVGGIDAGDLDWRLQQAGHPLLRDGA